MDGGVPRPVEDQLGRSPPEPMERHAHTRHVRTEYQIASIVTRTPAAKTFPVGLFDFTSQFTVDWRGMAAMSVLMMIPAILFVLVTARSLTRGLTFGAVKG
jgi:ABC-type maltose transport system permease subunit